MLLSIDNSASNQWHTRSQSESNPMAPKPNCFSPDKPLRGATFPTTNAALLFWHHHLGPVWPCTSDTVHNQAQLKWQQEFKSQSSQKRCAHALPRARSCPYSKHTLTLSSLMDFCRETWNIIAQWAVYHVCQSKHFQLSRRPRCLTVASCQTLCFISHLTHDSCSSTVSPGTMYRHYFCAGLGKKKKRGVTTLDSTYFAGIFWDSFWRSPANFGSSYIIRKWYCHLG